MADLEYRIRQHTDVYRQLRASKGAVVLDAAGGAGGLQKAELCDQEAESEVCSSSRTRPCSGTFRKRRLIRAAAVLSAAPAGSRRAGRHSTVRCCCVQSRIYNPCVLCGGKSNYLLPVDPDAMTVSERVGLVDRGFHPVLSLPHDIPLSAHVDSLLKSADWRTPTPAALVSNNRRGSKPGAEDDTVPVPKKKSLKRKQKTSVSNNGERLEVTGNGGAATASGKLERRKALLKRRKRTTLSTEPIDDDSGSAFNPSSPCVSAETASMSSSVSSTPGRPVRERSVFHDLMRRRTSYDIDNIVIPYSMAATTRVERLQYKEILTPKWRSVDEETLKAESVTFIHSVVLVCVPIFNYYFFFFNYS